MFNLYDNIQTLCERKGVTVSGMCIAIGKSKSILSNLKNGRSDTLAMRTAQMIADYLQVPLDVVLHGEKETPAAESDGRDTIDLSGLDEDQREIAHAFMNLPPQKRAALVEFAKTLEAGE